MSDIEAQVAALRAEVAELRELIQTGGPRLGPRRETPEESKAKASALADKLVEAVKVAKVEPPPVDRSALCTTDGRPVAEARASQTNETGQHPSHIVLCDAERAKGFVRPYRDRYKHVGLRICGHTVLGSSGDMVCYMDPGHEGDCGVAKGPRRFSCGGVTTMGRALSETYARDPKFYGSTFCCGCNRHLPVEEFVWSADGARVGS
jgi:hypothetical protein